MNMRLTYLDRQIKPLLDAHGFRRYDDFMNTDLGQSVSRSHSTETRRLVLRAPNTLGESSGHARQVETVFLKVYRYDQHNRRARFRADKAEREVRNYCLLRDRCAIPVPDILAYGSRTNRRHRLDAFIMTRCVPHAIPLDAFVDDHWPNPRIPFADPLRRYLLCKTARLLAQIHAAGFSHVDLQWRNLIVSNDGSDEPNLYVIDSSRGNVHHWSVRREHGRIRDLSSLYKVARKRLSATEQLRWLRTYFDTPRLNETHRALIRTLHSDRLIKDNEVEP